MHCQEPMSGFQVFLHYRLPILKMTMVRTCGCEVWFLSFRGSPLLGQIPEFAPQTRLHLKVTSTYFYLKKNLTKGRDCSCLKVYVEFAQIGSRAHATLVFRYLERHSSLRFQHPSLSSQRGSCKTGGIAFRVMLLFCRKRILIVEGYLYSSHTLLLIHTFILIFYALTYEPTFIENSVLACVWKYW